MPTGGEGTGGGEPGDKDSGRGEEEGGAARGPYRPSVSRDADEYVYIVHPMTVDKALTFIKGTSNHIVDFYNIFIPESASEGPAEREQNMILCRNDIKRGGRCFVRAECVARMSRNVTHTDAATTALMF